MLPGRSQDSLLASMDFIFTLLAIPQMAATQLVGSFSLFVGFLYSILVLLSLIYFLMTSFFFLVACSITVSLK